MISRLRIWWQLRTGEYETPFDDSIPAWFFSVLLHLGILFCVALLTIPTYDPPQSLILEAPLAEVEAPIDANEFEFSEIELDQVGSESVAGADAALSQAPIIADVVEITVPELDWSDDMAVEIDPLQALDTGLVLNHDLLVKGTIGIGTTGAAGAVDRLTLEILQSLEERPTLVVWLFDQSASLIRQRQQIHDRIERIYDELGSVTGRYKTRATAHPLVSSVIAFGKNVELLNKKPTDDVNVLKKTLMEIQRDDTGVENVFQAILAATDRFKRLRTTRARNVMLVVFTDEAGDDHQQYLERCVTACRRFEMPVYVIGVPAPFGRRKAAIKWVDPDPNYDQSPQRGLVDQGPESLMPERIQLKFPGMGEIDPMIDSGFGPFALTRLCAESGGIYFSVHGNRRTDRDVRDWQTKDYASYLRRFFDPATMRAYQPDYVSVDEYLRRAKASPMRATLVKAAATDWGSGIEAPRTRFVKRDEGSFVNQLSEAQKAAAVLEPRLNRLFTMLETGESARDKELTLRWQAGYDLAYGRALAAKVRTEAYNIMLAQAKQGMKFKSGENNTWILRPSDEMELSSGITKHASKARTLLHRVAEEHGGTPWSYLAELELKLPIGWKWVESFTDLSPRERRATNNNNNNRPPRNDQKRMLERPKQRRPLPKL